MLSESHEGLKTAATEGRSATSPRYRVYLLRNSLAHAGKRQRRTVLAAIDSTLCQDDFKVAATPWRVVADQFDEKLPTPMPAGLTSQLSKTATYLIAAEHPEIDELVRRPASIFRRTESRNANCVRPRENSADRTKSMLTK